MNQSERSRLLRSPVGRKITDLLNDALDDARFLPGKAALRERIAEEFGDVEGVDQDKLYNLFCEMARRGQDRSKRFELRGSIFEIAIKVSGKLEADDRLVPIEEPSDDEVKAAVDKADDPYGNRIGGDLDKERDAERAEAQDLIRRASEF